MPYLSPSSSLIPFLDDPHVRVRHSTITTLAILCTELAPEVEKRHHKVLMEGMWKSMDSENIKIKAQAVGCIVNFCKGVMEDDSELVEPYAGTLLERLAKLFELSLTQNYLPLQAEVLSAMSMIATLIKSKFAQYYGTFIPGLKRLLATTPMTTPRQKELRANTIKTIGNMIYAVGDIKENKEAVLKDARTFCSELIALLDSKLADDDPQALAIYNFWGEVTCVLGEGIGEYLPKILPPMFVFAKADMQVKIRDAQNPVKNECKEELTLTLGEVNISVNTMAFQSKMMAANVLLEICENAKKTFRPYSEEMAQIAVDLIKLKTSGNLKRTGSKFLRPLMMTCNTTDEMLKIFTFVYPAMREAIMTTVITEQFRDMKRFLKELYGGIQLFEHGPQMLSMEGMQDLCGVLGQCLSSFSKLHKEKAEALKAGKELNEDDIEEIEGEIEKFAKLTTYVLDICGVIGKHYGLQAESAFITKIIPHFVYFWEAAGNSSQLKLSSICFFCDVIEYFHGAAVFPRT